MRGIRDVAVVLLCIAAEGHPHHVRPRNEITLSIESLAPNPVAVRAIVSSGPRRPDGTRPRADSTSGKTPLSIPLDSAAEEIHITTARDEAVRVRIVGEHEELQRPSLVWGRDIRLRRTGNHFDVVAGAILITP